MGIAKFASDKKWLAQRVRALDFKKWGSRLEPSSLVREVYAYVHSDLLQIKHICLPAIL